MSFTQKDLEDYWKNTLLCTKQLPIIFNDYYNNIQYPLFSVLSLINLDKAKEILDLYKLENIFTKQNNNNFEPFIKTINDCFNQKFFDQNILLNKISKWPFIEQKKNYSNYKLNILYPGIWYKNGYTLISDSKICKLEICTNNYTMALYENSNSNTKYKTIPYWNYKHRVESKRFNINNNTNMIYMNSNGNLEIYNTKNIPLWESGTSGNPGAYCELLDNGFLVIKLSDNTIIKCLNTINENSANLDAYRGFMNWSYTPGYALTGGEELCVNNSTTIIPNFRYSNGFSWKNGNFILIIHSNGNLVLYQINPNKVLWETNTESTGKQIGTTTSYDTINLDNHLMFQLDDGNLVLWKKNSGPALKGYNPVAWSSNTQGKILTKRKIQLLESGYLVIFDDNDNIYKTYPHQQIINFLKAVKYNPSNNWVMDFLTIHIFKLGKDRWSLEYQKQLISDF